MKRLISIIIALSIFCISTIASAKSHRNWIGPQFDVGIPDGLVLGVAFRPINQLRLVASGTYALGPGIRGEATFDPIVFPVAPTLTVDVGRDFGSRVPFIGTKSPHIDYWYTNFQLGLEFGNRNSWRFFLRGGPTWIDLHAQQLNNLIADSSLKISDAEAKGWIPSAKVGFVLLF